MGSLSQEPHLPPSRHPLWSWHGISLENEGQWGPHTEAHSTSAPTHPGQIELEPPRGQWNLRQAPSSTSAAFRPPRPWELEPGCLRGQASNSPGQLWLLGTSPGQVAHSYPPESKQPEPRLSQRRGPCGGLLLQGKARMVPRSHTPSLLFSLMENSPCSICSETTGLSHNPRKVSLD